VASACDFRRDANRIKDAHAFGVKVHCPGQGERRGLALQNDYGQAMSGQEVGEGGPYRTHPDDGNIEKHLVSKFF
jgi:hypothetical protein